MAILCQLWSEGRGFSSGLQDRNHLRSFMFLGGKARPSRVLCWLSLATLFVGWMVALERRSVLERTPDHLPTPMYSDL